MAENVCTGEGNLMLIKYWLVVRHADGGKISRDADDKHDCRLLKIGNTVKINTKKLAGRSWAPNRYM